MFTKRQHFPNHLFLFPIEDAVLIPSSQIYLPVTEEKQFEAIMSVWNTHRMIGVVQIKGEEFSLENAPLFNTGTAGRILDINYKEESKVYMTVSGERRFKIIEEIDNREGLRSASVDYSTYLHDTVNYKDFSFDREKFFKTLKTYFKRYNIEANWQDLHDVSTEHLITTLAMTCPFTSSEKQALLQCQSIKERSHMVMSFINMANFEHLDSSSTTFH
jgi:hypothetical protein